MTEIGLKIDKTLRYYLSKGIIKGRDLRWKLSPQIAESPVFILGCSRAGTTLVYKTFSASPQLGSIQKETHDLWASLHPLEQRDWKSHVLLKEDASDRDRAFISRFFYGQTGTLNFVDKNNQNGLCLSYLLALFPAARFVYVKRSPGDNINSLIEGWRKADEFATWSNSLPVDVNVENGEFKRWCFFLPEGWKNYLSSSVEEVCAFQYQAMNDMILAGRDMVPEKQWVEICYEDLLNDPVRGFQAAFEAIDLEFGETLEKHCQTVLSRPYNAFSEIRLNKWKDGRNADKVARVLSLVENTALKMGYK